MPGHQPKTSLEKQIVNETIRQRISNKMLAQQVESTISLYVCVCVREREGGGEREGEGRVVATVAMLWPGCVYERGEG